MMATVAHVKSLPSSLTVALTSSGHFLHWREKIETTADGWTALIRAGGIH